MSRDPGQRFPCKYDVDNAELMLGQADGDKNIPQPSSEQSGRIELPIVNDGRWTHNTQVDAQLLASGDGDSLRLDLPPRVGAARSRIRLDRTLVSQALAARRHSQNRDAADVHEAFDAGCSRRAQNVLDGVDRIFLVLLPAP